MIEVWVNLLTIFGQLLTLCGAIVAAKAVMLDEVKAIEIGIPRWADEDMSKNLTLPAIQNLLSASRSARNGLWMVAAGTGFQIVAPVVGVFGVMQRL